MVDNQPVRLALAESVFPNGEITPHVLSIWIRNRERLSGVIRSGE